MFCPEAFLRWPEDKALRVDSAGCVDGIRQVTRGRFGSLKHVRKDFDSTVLFLCVHARNIDIIQMISLSFLVQDHDLLFRSSSGQAKGSQDLELHLAQWHYAFMAYKLEGLRIH